MRRLIDLSFLLQGGKNVFGYSDQEKEAALKMYEYVNYYSGNFTCSYSYLSTLWHASYFKIVGYNF